MQIMNLIYKSICIDNKIVCFRYILLGVNSTYIKYLSGKQ